MLDFSHKKSSCFILQADGNGNSKLFAAGTQHHAGCTLSHRGGDLRATRAGFDADGQPPLRAPDHEPSEQLSMAAGLD
jgi:hypothetical protein